MTPNDAFRLALNDIVRRRNEIKEQYIRAWLATLPDEYLGDVDWVLQNCELIEERSGDGLRSTFRMHMRPSFGDLLP